MIVVDESWLQVSEGRVLIENLYLKLSRTAVRPDFTFITAGSPIAHASAVHNWQPIRTTVYVTGTTFQAEHRGNARGVRTAFKQTSLYLESAYCQNPRPHAVCVRCRKTSFQQKYCC